MSTTREPGVLKSSGLKINETLLNRATVYL